MEFDTARGLEVLERTPRALREMLHGLDAAWLDANEGPDTWSPREVIAHLVNGERTDWIVRAHIIVEQRGDRRFVPFDRAAHRAGDGPGSIESLLDQFAALRADSLATLRGWQLDDAKLALRGVHPEFGEVTLAQLLATWTAHDLGHTVQIARVMARQYEAAVGPWSAYLSVMRPR
jgi:hypothetical protein